MSKIKGFSFFKKEIQCISNSQGEESIGFSDAQITDKFTLNNVFSSIIFPMYISHIQPSELEYKVKQFTMRFKEIFKNNSQCLSNSSPEEH